MTANASRDVLYFATGAILLVRTYQLIRLDWSRPLRHGPGFFLAFEVPSGFYSGTGARWLTRFRTVLLTEYGTEWLTAAGMIAFGWWRWLPCWAGVSAVLYVGSLSLFGAAAGRHLGLAGRPSAVALWFEKRRVRDYLSPAAEALMTALVAAGWWLLVMRGDANIRWGAPVVLTYAVVAMFAAKIVVINAGAPLPTDRTEQHYRYFEAGRRYGLRVIDVARWFFAFIVFSYAVLHCQWQISATNWLTWSLIATASGIWLALVFAIVRGARQLDAMGRTLRPAMSWAGPFPSNPWASRGGGVWAVSFLAGLLALFAVFGFGLTP